MLLDGNVCEIAAVTPNTIDCVTPPASAAHTAQLQVVSNDVNYATIDFIYSDQDTPQMTSLSITSGYPGDALTISGARFGTAAENVAVWVDVAVCVVTSIVDDSVECTLGAHAAGTFDVRLHVSPLGSAFGQLSFTYGLVVTGITPNNGKHGALSFQHEEFKGNAHFHLLTERLFHRTLSLRFGHCETEFTIIYNGC